MGWGQGDEDRVTTAKVALSRLRQASYVPKRVLKETLESIAHDEKRKVLLNLLTRYEQTLDEIGVQLDR